MWVRSRVLAAVACLLLMSTGASLQSQPPLVPPEGPLAYLVRTTGKDEATCRFFLECGGGDPEQARLIMQQNGRI